MADPADPPGLRLSSVRAWLDRAGIGTGFIADVIAHAIRDADPVEITGVASRRVDVAREFASKHGHPRVFASWAETRPCAGGEPPTITSTMRYGFA